MVFQIDRRERDVKTTKNQACLGKFFGGVLTYKPLLRRGFWRRKPPKPRLLNFGLKSLRAPAGGAFCGRSWGGVASLRSRW